MSAEHESGDLRPGQSTRTGTSTDSDRNADFDSDAPADAAVATGPSSIDVAAVEQCSTTPSPSQIERVRLRAQVAVLERELAASESRRLAIVGQYERILEEQCACDDRRDDGVRGVVRRLVSDRK